MQCCYDYNGNHVVQKVIIEMGSISVYDPQANQLGLEEIKFIIEVLEQDFVNFCLHEYCCRIVQRMFENIPPELLENTCKIITTNL